VPRRRSGSAPEPRAGQAAPLTRYQAKRDFGKTPEPAGDPSEAAQRAVSQPPRGRRRFVVQRHRATRLHFDFRLEIDGVLVSWAVPKGPTLDPAVRRMAVHVEDHSLEYFDFEGVIPARQYGAGDVIVWDWGIWEPEDETPDPGPAVHDGELKFRLHGEKLSGRYTIVRTGRAERRRASGEEGEGDPWLLIKKRDEAASAGWDAEDHPRSVKTGRTNDDVKARRDAVWVSRAPAADAEIDLAAAVPEPTPDFIAPMLATLTDRPFSDPDWLYEIKWDGYRIEAVVRDGTVRLWTRNGKDGAAYFGDFLSPPTWIDAREAIVDGEVVAIGPDGRPDFGLLQEAGGRRTRARKAIEEPLVYQAFDLLRLDGRSLLHVPLEDRKRLLRSVLREQHRVKYAGHLVAEGRAFYEAAAQQGLEGIIAKLRSSRYEPGRRSPAWLKNGGSSAGSGRERATGLMFDLGPVLRFLPDLLNGLLITFLLTVSSMIIGTGVGIVLALARLSGRAMLARPALIYTEFFRTTPLLVQMFWINFSLPAVIRGFVPYFDIDPLTAGILSLGLNTGAYFGEMFRGGILAIERGQWDAAHVLGLSRRDAFLSVITPQAVKVIIPPFAANTMLLLKGTAIVAGISVAELTYKASLVSVPTGRFVEVWTVVAVIYFVVIYPIGVVAGAIERRYKASERGARPGRAGR